jgi:hypothetical protein
MNPPPAGTDPIVAAQMRLLQQMTNTKTEMQAQMRQERQEMRQDRQEIRQEMRQERLEMRQVQQEQQLLPPPPAPSMDKNREFMSHKPPTFSNSSDPLQADDWLKSMDKMLNIAQCSDRKKVLYASGCLTGPAAIGVMHIAMLMLLLTPSLGQNSPLNLGITIFPLVL